MLQEKKRYKTDEGSNGKIKLNQLFTFLRCVDIVSRHLSGDVLRFARCQISQCLELDEPAFYFTCDGVHGIFVMFSIGILRFSRFFFFFFVFV